MILFVCDGAKPNRKFLNSMGRESEMKHGVMYKTVNRFCQERFIYFMSDVPHLIKTTRNCWYSSKTGGARYMWVCTCQHKEFPKKFCTHIPLNLAATLNCTLTL